MQPQTLRKFFKQRAIIALIVIVICAMVFVYAMQITSVLVFSDEAMRARAQYAIGTDTTMMSDSYLERFFSDEYLNSGELQKLRATYEGITVTSYMQLASNQWVWTWPWGGTAYVKVHDKVSGIVGDVTDDERGLNEIPAWPSGVYAMTLKKRNGVWHVEHMELISVDAQPTPEPTQ